MPQVGAPRTSRGQHFVAVDHGDSICLQALKSAVENRAIYANRGREPVAGPALTVGE